MKTNPEPGKKLHSTDEKIEKLEDRCALLEQENEKLSAKVKWYEEQYRLSKQQEYGTSSERTSELQGRLFDEAEAETDPKATEPVFEEITYRRKKKGKKDKLPKSLPVETIEYELPEDERNCPQCDGTLHEMSKEVRKELKVIPAEVKVIEHVRNVYACRNCEKNDISTPVVTASMPEPVLPGSIVSPSLMAFIMNRKYSEAMPLYRQEQQFKHFGIELSRQTLSNWIIHGGNNWLKHLYDQMHAHLLEHDILHADDYRNNYIIETDL